MAQDNALEKLGAWGETFKVAVAPFGTGGLTTWYDFQTFASTFSISGLKKDFEYMATGSGGGVIKLTPMEPFEITMDLYPVEANIGGEAGMSQGFMELQASWDASEPIAATLTRSRESWAVAILLTDDGANTGANVATASSTNSYRFVAVHGQITSYDQDFSDGMLKATVTFKFAPFNKQGIGQYHEDSGDGTALVAVSNFNTTNFNPESTSAYTWTGGA